MSHRPILHRTTPSLHKLRPRRPSAAWPRVPAAWYLPHLAVSIVPFVGGKSETTEPHPASLARCCYEAAAVRALGLEEEEDCWAYGDGQPCWLLFDRLKDREASCDYLTREAFRNTHDPDETLDAHELLADDSGEEEQNTREVPQPRKVRLERVHFPRRPRCGWDKEPLVGYAVVSRC